ncbi:zinc-binding dehydrogenase [Amycolatopsis sp. FDAARGOS 1241]|uniref:zinc-dependent alcohol dehydrogenase n=1 Tax=Amycolatopsis sp. FDAARGOS 1241 TaxID=2778070 RepID=UPI00194EE3E7|nr:zinc-binding dehydrogenase [Amycolatopsis sp. FDAARGOS 1241]QRP49397.1 zinc-binding dehydrogenase [Amycolatopsis sp. FDAARGOS 1241]
MKALRFTAADAVSVDELEVPRIAAGEVLVAARSVGICHSDIELLEGRYIIPFSYPVIPGHEWSGEIVETGADVTDFAPGDRVVGECVIGADHFGFSISGAAAEFFVAKPAWLHRLPDSLSFTDGALVEPFSCGYHALLKAGNVNASDTVVVFGAGPIGLGVTAGAAALGARTITVEPAAGRAEAARKLGAELVLDPAAAPIAEQVAESTGGVGGTVVIEATGRPAVMADVLKVAAHGARIVYVGIDVGGSAPAELGLIQSKELAIRGIIGSPGVWPDTLRFLDRAGLDLSELVTSRFPVSRAAEAIAASRDTARNIKVHLEFGATR